MIKPLARTMCKKENGDLFVTWFRSDSLEEMLEFRDTVGKACFDAEICVVRLQTDVYRIHTLLRKAATALLLLLAVGTMTCRAALSPAQETQLVGAIKKVEGLRSRHPYGILKTTNSKKAKRICLFTVRRLRLEWENLRSPIPVDWLNYLADGYCPAETDPVGNRNWKTNIHKLIK